MWYYNNRGPRHMRRGFFFPFFIPFIFLFVLKSFPAFILSFIFMAVIFAFVMAAMRGGRGNYYQQPFANQPPQNTQGYQNPYYQPMQNQSRANPYYQLYQQGYQQQRASQAGSGVQSVGSNQYQQPSSEQYEQPLADYPEPMPPPQQ